MVKTLDLTEKERGTSGTTMTPRGARASEPRTPLTQSHLRATRQSMMREPCGNATKFSIQAGHTYRRDPHLSNRPDDGQELFVCQPSSMALILARKYAEPE